MCQTNKARCNAVSMWDETHIRMNERKKNTCWQALSLLPETKKAIISPLCSAFESRQRHINAIYKKTNPIYLLGKKVSVTGKSELACHLY